jgi:hypothetical protein
MNVINLVPSTDGQQHKEWVSRTAGSEKDKQPLPSLPALLPLDSVISSTHANNKTVKTMCTQEFALKI